MIARARKGEDGIDRQILAALKAETNALWRASLVSLLRTATTNEVVITALKSAAEDRSALVRGYSLRAVEPLAQTDATIGELMNRHLGDTSRYARNEAAWALRATVDTNTGAGRELMGQLAQRGKATGILLYDDVIPVDESFTLTYDTLTSDDWERKLPVLERERGRVSARMNR